MRLGVAVLLLALSGPAFADIVPPYAPPKDAVQDDLPPPTGPPLLTSAWALPAATVAGSLLPSALGVVRQRGKASSRD